LIGSGDAAHFRGQQDNNPKERDMSYTETRTQEDIAEIHAEHNLGCKACEQPIRFGEAVTCEGDIYCWTCGLKLDEMPGNDVQVLPTREQVAELARWDAAGIGAN
jgi:predicted amidophosphoribosyltransferase